jgi:hypothetical protein
MANVNINSIDNYLVPGAAGIAYTTPANTKTVIQKLTATSQESAAARLLTLYKVPPAAAAGPTNIIVDKLSIPPNAAGSGITDIPGMVNQVLESGYTLQALIDSGVTVYLNGSVLETS